MKTRIIKGEELEESMVMVGFMDRTARVTEVRFDHAHSTYVKFRVEGMPWDRLDRHADVTIQADAEKLYLVCDCGEAFDTIQTAHDHVCDIDSDRAFEIKPESEAM